MLFYETRTFSTLRSYTHGKGMAVTRIGRRVQLWLPIKWARVAARISQVTGLEVLPVFLSRSYRLSHHLIT